MPDLIVDFEEDADINGSEFFFQQEAASNRISLITPPQGARDGTKCASCHTEPNDIGSPSFARADLTAGGDGVSTANVYGGEQEFAFSICFPTAAQDVDWGDGFIWDGHGGPDGSWYGLTNFHPIDDPVDTCASGSTTTVLQTNLPDTGDGHWDNHNITFTSGANNGQTKTISSYVGSTGVLTTAAFPFAPANGDQFTIRHFYTWNNFMFFVERPSGVNTFSLTLVGGNLTASGIGAQQRFDFDPITLGEWLDVVIHVKWHATTAARTRVWIWRNNTDSYYVEKLDTDHPNCHTENGIFTPHYLKLANYNTQGVGGGAATPSTVLYDRVRRGTSFADVAISEGSAPAHHPIASMNVF